MSMKKREISVYDLMKEYKVQAKSVKDFCERYHSRAAYHDRGKDYMDFDLQSHIKEFKEEGYTLSPQGSSTTGDIVSFYGRGEEKL
jgi:adenine specific DNA methylase Mod